MIDGKLLVEKLLVYSKAHLYLPDDDIVYTRNLLLRELKLTSPYDGGEDVSYVGRLDVPDELFAELEGLARQNDLSEEGYENIFATHIFGLLTPPPSVINAEFNRIKAQHGIQQACDYLHGISVKNNYVQKTAIGRNLKWEYADGSNVLEITVNLSKPEKDNKDIAKLLLKQATTQKKYPACALCKENLGYGGTLAHPARSNIRTVNLTLGGQPWFVQYSPYAYYNEHCIAISNFHTPMVVDATTPEKLLDFIDVFPNYFIGSNAALPIVGGSILNHEHFQGGRHKLPMSKADIKIPLKSKRYPDVACGILNWYNSAIRLRSKNRKSLSLLTADIISAWTNYTDEAVGIYSTTDDGVRHSTLSPIASKDGEYYVMDIILRNNITSEQYPDGVFHAHPEYFNIKKEGIGLIEAMGLFILPGRLKRQTAEIEKILTGERLWNGTLADDDDLSVHKHMINELVRQNGTSLSGSEAKSKVVDYINKVCANILDCTAVFKQDKLGQKSFLKFVNSAGLIEETP